MRANGKTNGNSGKRILVVEGDPYALKALVAMLGFLGYASDGAPTIEHALLCARTKAPDLVLLDIYLGEGASGGSCLEQLRKVPGLANVKVGWLTGHGPTADSLECAGENPYPVIRKPLNLDELRFAAEQAFCWQPRGDHTAPKIPVRVDFDRRIVNVKDVEYRLSKQRFNLFELLFRSPGRACSHEKICQSLAHAPDGHYARVVVDRLREKLGPEAPHLIITIDKGFRLVID